MFDVHRPGRRGVGRALSAAAIIAVLAALLPGAALAAVVQRLEADDTISAALVWSQFAYPDGGVTTALIGRADDFPDALSSGGLQGAAEQGSPLLLTPTDAPIAQDVLVELDRLGVTEVIILGGVNAISEGVEADLRDAGYAVSRLEGPERIATALAIARATYPQAGAAVLARAQADAEDPSRAFADSLAAGAFAASMQAPVLLNPTGELDAGVLSYLYEAGVETVFIVGGELAISSQVEAALVDAGFGVQRLGGDDRTATAVTVAFAQFSGGPPNAVALIEGSTPDAWASGLPAAAASATQGIALLLTAGPTLPPETQEALEFVGGTPVVCGPLVDPAACDAADAPPPEPPGEIAAEGLVNPRDVELGPEGEVYVTLQGTGGEDCIEHPEFGEICFGRTSQVAQFDPATGEVAPVVDGLSSISFGVGASDVVVDGDGVFHIAMGLGAPPETREQFPESADQLGTYVQATADGEAAIVADVAGHEGAENPDGVEPPDSNPYAIALATDGGVVIADAGGNSLVRVDEEGTVSTLAVFPEVETEEGPREAVPTSIAVGPDGAYYIGELGGEVPGASRIWRVPAEGGEPEIHAEGLTFVIDLAFDGEGNLYTLQLFPTGVLTRISPEGEQVVLSDGEFNAPLGLAVAADGLYVVNCGLGCQDGGQLVFVSFDELAERFAAAQLDHGEPEGYASPVHEEWGDHIGPR